MRWLWILLVNLRAPADAHVLPDPARARRCRNKLNWHQHHERELALIRAQVGAPCKHTSRAAAWRTVAAALKEQVAATDAEEVVQLASGMIVLASPPGLQRWFVGCVLSLWRSTPRGCKATHLPTPVVESLRCCRVALMDPVAGAAEGFFEVSATSEVAVVAMYRVGLVLQTQVTTPGVDGFRCRLTDLSLECVQRAHEKTDWPAGLHRLRLGFRARHFLEHRSRRLRFLARHFLGHRGRRS